MNNYLDNLFHYTNEDSALKILSNMSLRFSKLNNTNDPRENCGFDFSTISNRESKMLSQHELSAKLRGDAKLICFAKHHLPLYHGYEYSSLWAHYAGKFTGVCFGIDKDKFIDENKSIIDESLFRRVIYVDVDALRIIPHIEINYIKMQVVGEDNYFKSLREEHKEFLFFTKNKDWENEREERILKFSNAEEEYCSIGKSLTDVYLGGNFRSDKVEEVKQLVGDSVKVHRMEYSHVRLVPVTL